MTIIIILACIFFSCKNIYGSKSNKKNLKQPEITAESFAVISISTGERVYTKNPERKQFIAGPERLMCAICVIDNMHDKKKEMENYVTIPAKYVRENDMFKEGQGVKVKDLLYAVIISGSAAAELSLAEYSSGSQEEFISCMNNKAKELKLKNTNFSSVTADYDDNQYTTVEDYALLTRAAMNNSYIKKMAGKKGYKIKTDKGETVPVKNSEEVIEDASKAKKKSYSIFAGIIYNDGGENDVSYMLSAANKDIELVTVISNVKKENASKEINNLISYGFIKVNKTVAVEKGKKAGYVWIRNGEKTLVPVYTKNRAYVYLPKEASKSLIVTKKNIGKNLNAPIKSGTKVGEYDVYVGDEFQGTVDLVVKKTISKGLFPSKIYISNMATYVVVGLIGFLILLRIERKNRKKRRIRKNKMKRREKARKIARRELAREDNRKNRNRY